MQYIRTGFKLTDSNQFYFYDDSIGSWEYITIPAGIYFFQATEGAENIVSTLNSIFSGHITFSYQNSFQISVDFLDAGDELLLADSEDSEILARALGLYDNDLNMNYYKSAPISDGLITQVTLTQLILADGVDHNAFNLDGFPDPASVHYETAAGIITPSTIGLKNTLNLNFNHIDGDLFDRRTFELQDSLGISEISNYSGNFWAAFDPRYSEPVFLHTDPNSIERKMYLQSPVKASDVRQTTQSINFLFDWAANVNIIDRAPEKSKYPYNGGVNSVFYIQDAKLPWYGSFSFILRAYLKDWDTTNAFLINAWRGGLTGIPMAFRITTGGQLNYWQGTQADYQTFNTAFILSKNAWIDLLVTREGVTGTNNLTVCLSPTNKYSYSLTKSNLGSDPLSLTLFEYGGIYFNYSTLAFLDKCIILGRVLNNIEISDYYNRGIVPKDSIVSYLCREGGGNYLLDSSANKINMPLTNVVWGNP